MDKHTIHKTKEQLLGIKHRVVFNNLSTDATERNYFVSYDNQIVKVTDTATGEIIIIRANDGIYTEPGPVYVISRISDDIHIVGIYDENFETGMHPPEKNWQTNTGVNTDLIENLNIGYKPICQYLYLCERESTSQISQFYAAGDLLAIDIVDGSTIPKWSKEMPIMEFGSFYRKVIRISDGKEIYSGKKSRYFSERQSWVEDNYGLWRIVPHTAFFETGLVVIPEESMKKLAKFGDFPSYAVAQCEVVVYNLLGELIHRGIVQMEIGGFRIYNMDYVNDKRMENYLRLLKQTEDKNKWAWIHDSLQQIPK
jgi:hypothetical protein